MKLIHRRFINIVRLYSFYVYCERISDIWICCGGDSYGDARSNSISIYVVRCAEWRVGLETRTTLYTRSTPVVGFRSRTVHFFRCYIVQNACWNERWNLALDFYRIRIFFYVELLEECPQRESTHRNKASKIARRVENS